MNFIKLTKTGSSTIIRVNFNSVKSYVRYNDNQYTTINFNVTDSQVEVVRETPEEIDTLLGLSEVNFEQSIG